MAHYSTNDVVSFDKDGKTHTGTIVTYDPYSADTVYVVECGEGMENRFHVPESKLREAEQSA